MRSGGRRSNAEIKTHQCVNRPGTIDRDLIKTQSFGVYNAQTTRNTRCTPLVPFITDLLGRNDMQTDISIYYG